jgi:hypothetical protein
MIVAMVIFPSIGMYIGGRVAGVDPVPVVATWSAIFLLIVFCLIKFPVF